MSIEQDEPSTEWDETKENFRPIAQGRSIAELTKVSERDNCRTDIEDERKAYWKLIAEYNGTDPIEPWLSFIKWTQQTFASGGQKAELVPLLESCTRDLQKLPQYQNDQRYIRIWITYADNVADPKEIFQFMQANQIGQECTLFYTAYAAFLEHRGSYAKADKAYTDGINRRAQPLERLQQKHTEFQYRMARRIQLKAQQEALQGAGSGGEAAQASQAPARTTLGIVKQRHPPSTGNAQARRIAKPAATASSLDGGKGNCNDFAVFEDGAEGGEGPSHSSSAAPGASWAELGAQTDTRKENIQKANKWAGTKLKQKPVVAAAVIAEPLDVYEDEEIVRQQQQAEALKLQQDAAKMPLRRMIDAGDRRRPSRHELAQAAVNFPTASTSASGTDVRTQALPAKPAVVLGWDQSLLQDSLPREGRHAGGSGMECCFEEHRAAAWLALQTHDGQTQDMLPMGKPLSPVMEVSKEGTQDSCAVSCATSGAGSGAPLQEVTQPLMNPQPSVLESVPEQMTTTSITLSFVAEELPSCADLETSEAPAVEAPQAQQAKCPPLLPDCGFSQPDVGKAEVIRTDILPSFPEPSSHFATATMRGMSHLGMFAEATGTLFGGYAEPTVTINTREALSTMNRMFNAALPHEIAHVATAAHQLMGPDPTVTFNTMEALKALGQAFEGPVSEGSSAANMAFSGCADDVGFAAYEDTALLPGAEEAVNVERKMFALSVRDDDGLQVYEDTQLFVHQPTTSPQGFEVHEDTGLIAAAPVATQTRENKLARRLV